MEPEPSISNLTDSIELGTITTAQLALSAAGAITDSGVITVSGTTAFDNSAGTDAAIDWIQQVLTQVM